MTSNDNISRFKQGILVLLGLIIACFVVTQEVVEYQCNQAYEEATDDEDSEDDAVFTIAYDEFIPSASLELTPNEPFLIAEVLFEEQTFEQSLEEVSLYDTPHNKTLFRRIISTNAP